MWLQCSTTQSLRGFCYSVVMLRLLVLNVWVQVPGMLAAGAGDVVSVWQLPQRLVEPRAGETKLLRRMLDSEDVAALLRAQCIVGP
jgi:hypothetical protein